MGGGVRCFRHLSLFLKPLRLYILTEIFQNVTFHICIVNPFAVIFVYGVRKKSSIFSCINNYPSTTYWGVPPSPNNLSYHIRASCVHVPIFELFLWSFCFSQCQYHIVSITTALNKTWYLLTLFLPENILAVLGPLLFYKF